MVAYVWVCVQMGIKGGLRLMLGIISIVINMHFLYYVGLHRLMGTALHQSNVEGSCLWGM